MKQSGYTDKTYNIILNNIKRLSEINRTSKSELAIILGVSERTVDNRLSGNLKTPFTLVELLKLSYFWGVPFQVLVSYNCSNIDDVVSALENEMQLATTMLRKQIEMKGTIS